MIALGLGALVMMLVEKGIVFTCLNVTELEDRMIVVSFSLQF